MKPNLKMSVSLIKVGNSNAVIIPAKVLKQMNITETTKFELSFEGNSIIQIRKIQPEPVFPKVTLPKVSAKEMNEFIKGLAKLDKKDFENDERASYILER